jgi:lipopolysaccharide export system permease protein
VTLDRYVFKLLLVRTVFAAIALIGLIQVIELLDVTTEILERGLGAAGIARYSLLRMPGMFQQIAPLSVLIGAIFTFTQLARNSEMVVIRATGANIYRVLKMMIPVALGVAALDFVVAAEVAPHSQDALRRWMDATAPASEVKTPKPHWFRLGRNLVLVTRISTDGTRMEGVRIYLRDQNAALTQEIAAPSATAQAGGWRLHDATVSRITGDRADLSKPADRDWQTPLKPEDVVRLFRAGDEISAGAALSALSRTGPQNRSPSFYQTRLHRTFAEPLAALVMLLLSAPAALASLRSDQGMRLMLFGLASGLLFVVVDGLLTALGETSALPPLLAAWSAPVAFAALAMTVLFYVEG